MAIEKYVAVASLGLFVMFVAEIITLYDFIIDPVRDVEAAPKVLQFISIGAAPAVILAGTAYLMARKHGSKLIGTLIIAGGAVMLAGMGYANTLLGKMESEFLVEDVVLTPPLFMVVSIPTIVFGSLLFRIKKRRPKKEYV